MLKNMTFLLFKKTNVLSRTQNMEGPWSKASLSRVPSSLTIIFFGGAGEMVIFPFLVSLFLPFSFNHNVKLLPV